MTNPTLVLTGTIINPYNAKPVLPVTTLSKKKRREIQERLVLDAFTLSRGSTDATLLVAQIVFLISKNGKLRNPLSVMKLRAAWDQLVDEDAGETKRLFRQMIDEKIAAWTADTDQ